MKKWICPMWLLIPVLMVSLCLLLTAHPRRAADFVYRELSVNEIRPMLKEITGKALPDKAEGLRAILWGECGIRELYLVFHTDQDGRSYIMEEFGGQNVEKHDFPDEKNCDSFRWTALRNFDRGYLFQRELGVMLFDRTLYDRIREDIMQRFEIGHYPEDAVSGHYLQFYDDTQPLLMWYQILMFPDRDLVYVCAGRRPKGLVLP